MNAQPTKEAAQLLQAWHRGDHAALDRLTPQADEQIQTLAHGYFLFEPADNLLLTMLLVNRTHLRLIEATTVAWQFRCSLAQRSLALSGKARRSSCWKR